MRVLAGGGDVNVAVGGTGVGVRLAVGVMVAVGTGVRLGTGVSVGTAVQVGGGAFQSKVGDGPGVRVGQGVALGTGDRRGAAVAEGRMKRGVGGFSVWLVSSRALAANAITTTATAPTSRRIR